MIFSAVFLAGLIGSPHCMSMCGPLVLNFSNKKSRLFAYQTGRMLAYSLAGAAVGAFGGGLLGPERPGWVSSFTLLIMGLLLFINGYRALAGKSYHLPIPKFMLRFSAK